MKCKISKIYCNIGKGLTAIAGAIVGFIAFGGATALVLGLVVGGIAGHLLEKVIIHPKNCC